MAIDITPKMAHSLILCLIEMKCEYVVAPYEADAQLAYLFKSGQADVVFTEDSDLLAFGCTHVFFKMDNLGNGQYIDLEQLSQVNQFENFTVDMLLITSILSGCDYLDSIKGIGFKKATKLVADHPEDTFEECLKVLEADPKLEVPFKYRKHF